MMTKLALILGIVAAPMAWAQEVQPFTGSITTGYRFTDVEGYQPKFQELFDLNGGLRLLDLNFSSGLKSAFADRYSMTLSGIGGDPYSTAQFQVRKNRVYDLRVNFRQSHYYWNRNDQAVLPNGLHALTSYHDWATVRKIGSVNLLVHATNNLRFSFEYLRNTRSGVTGTTRPMDYYGSPAAWGTFARANPYYLVAPMHEATDRGTAGIDYTRGGWNLHYKFGYQRFEDSVTLRNPLSPETSINVDDATTAKEPLTATLWSDYRRLSTPVSEFSYTGRPSRRLEARGGYIFYRYRGPASLDFSFSGIARTSGAYSVSSSMTARVTEPNHVMDQGFTYKVREWWSVLLDYRYSRFTVDSTAKLAATSAGVAAEGTALNQWRVGTHSLDLDMTFTPVSALLVRAGIRLLKSDVEALIDGGIDLTRTKRIKSVRPLASLYYQPFKTLAVRADVEQTNNGTSYTRITPHLDKGARFVVRYRPTDKFYLDDTAVVRSRELLQTDYHSRVRGNSTTANYEWSERFAVFAGFSYDSLFAADFVNFLRGTAPFTNVALRDQTVERVWHGGFRASPTPRLGLTFAGNFLRATGFGEIAGEAPLYGPMTFPYATGELHYDVPKIGRIQLQLQRTYYTEQIVPGNNFSANLLTIAWTRGFGK